MSSESNIPTSPRTRLRRVTRFALTLGLVLSTMAFGISWCSHSSAARPGFIHRNGATLMLDGAPYRFVGVNNYDLTGCHTGTPVAPADAEKFFAQLPPNTMTRVWAFGAQGIDGITQTVALAAKYNQKLILALADGAGYCGEPHYDEAFYKSGYQGAYFDWLTRVTSAFKDSAAVAIWEMMNEPGSSASGLTQDIMKSFFDATAARIKQNDSNHLVSTGLRGPYEGFADGVAGYAAVHSGPDVDLVSLHEYDYPYDDNRDIASDWFAVAQQAAQSLNKPIYIGEAGISLGSGCMTAAERADVLRQKFDVYLGAGAVGVQYWVVLGPPNNPGDVCNSLEGNRDPSLGGPIMDLIADYRPTG